MTRSWTARLVLAAALALGAACAAVEAPVAGPPPFRGVKKLVLVRRVDDPRAPRGRDPIDALKESLEARGYEARIVELPGPGAELRDLERLEDGIASHNWTRARSDGGAERAGGDAGALLARLGVDAVAGYHRFDARLAPLAPAPQPQPWASPPPFPSQQQAPRRPSAALSLVGADGSLAWFPWGGAGAEMDPNALLNAADAIDALLAVLAGEPADRG
jgi:hypothetical protein